MGKKYLLYIHHERFVTEPKKSDLVNKLLVEYYEVDSKDFAKINEPGAITPVKKVSPPKKIASEPKARIIDTELAVPGACKHGMHPAFCKHAKPGKECK